MLSATGYYPLKVSKIHPFGRYQRAIRRLIDIGPVISTRSVMQWGDRGRGALRQRWKWARAARRACRSLGLVAIGRVWPDGNLWARPGDPRLTDNEPTTR